MMRMMLKQKMKHVSDGDQWWMIFLMKHDYCWRLYVRWSLVGLVHFAVKEYADNKVECGPTNLTNLCVTAKGCWVQTPGEDPPSSPQKDAWEGEAHTQQHAVLLAVYQWLDRLVGQLWLSSSEWKRTTLCRSTRSAQDTQPKSSSSTRACFNCFPQGWLKLTNPTGNSAVWGGMMKSSQG